MDLFELYLKDITIKGIKMIEDSMKNGESEVFITSLKRNVNFSIQNQSRGFISCLLMCGKISESEASEQLNIILENFKV